MAKTLEHMTRSALIEWGVSEERAHDVHQALHKLSVKTVTWAAQEHVAGVDYNDESHDVEVGSDRDLSDGCRNIHGSEAEDIAFMREIRAVRRQTQRQVKVGRIRHASRFQPLAEYVLVFRFAMIEHLAHSLDIRADLRAYSQQHMRARVAWHNGALFHIVSQLA